MSLWIGEVAIISGSRGSEWNWHAFKFFEWDFQKQPLSSATSLKRQSANRKNPREGPEANPSESSGQRWPNPLSHAPLSTSGKRYVQKSTHGNWATGNLRQPLETIMSQSPLISLQVAATHPTTLRQIQGFDDLCYVVQDTVLINNNSKVR